MDHEVWMRVALEEARKAMEKEEVPVGAAIVDSDGILLARNHNRTNEMALPMAHAEALVIERACALRGDWRLNNTVLYSTLEPCLMCAGMIVLSRVSHVVYGAWDKRFGAFGSVTDVLAMPDLNHYPEVTGGVLAADSEELLRDFFRSRRNEGRS